MNFSTFLLESLLLLRPAAQLAISCSAEPYPAPAPANVLHPDGSSGLLISVEGFHHHWGDKYPYISFSISVRLRWCHGRDASSALSFICGYLESGLEKGLKEPSTRCFRSLINSETNMNHATCLHHVFVHFCRFWKLFHSRRSTKLALATHFCDYSPCSSPDCCLLRLSSFFLFTCFRKVFI